MADVECCAASRALTIKIEELAGQHRLCKGDFSNVRICNSVYAPLRYGFAARSDKDGFLKPSGMHSDSVLVKSESSSRIVPYAAKI